MTKNLESRLKTPWMIILSMVAGLPALGLTYILIRLDPQVAPKHTPPPKISIECLSTNNATFDTYVLERDDLYHLLVDSDNNPIQTDYCEHYGRTHDFNGNLRTEYKD